MPASEKDPLEDEWVESLETCLGDMMWPARREFVRELITAVRHDERARGVSGAAAAEGDVDPLLEKWVWRIHHRDASDPDALHRHVSEALAEARADERANAARVCKAKADDYLGKGKEIGWKLNATGALDAMDRILAGDRVPPPPAEGTG